MADKAPPTKEDAEDLKDARRDVRRVLGTKFEEKASDAFCLKQRRRISRGGHSATFGLEALAPASSSGPPSAIVLEFKEDQKPTTVSFEALNHTDIKKAAEVLREALPQGYNFRAGGMLRQAQVTAVRNECYRTIAPVYSEIERLSAGPLQPGPEIVGAAQIPTLMTQVCWLNRTVRTWAGPEALSEVAADKSVSRIDVPRRLMPEASFTANQKAIKLNQFAVNSEFSGKGVTVAVIDTEVALNHPALRQRVVQRRNFTPEPWGNPHGHGTAVAGIIAARDSQNAGIAPDAMIYNYKVLATNRFLNSDDFGGALALQQAVEDNVDIANCSWGAGPVGRTISREARAVVGATEAGMTVVKSAGNSGPNGMTMTSPAEAPEAIVVGATDIDGKSVQDYSSRGAAGARLGPDVVAPGGTQDVQIICCQVGGGFGSAGAGTSFAAPHISGVLALLLEQDPELTPELLLRWVRDHGKVRPGFKVADQGQGLLILT